MTVLAVDYDEARGTIDRNVEQFAASIVDDANRRVRYGKWPQAEKYIDGKLREAVQLLPELFKRRIRDLIGSDWEVSFEYNDCCTPTIVTVRLKPKPSVTP